MKKLEQEKPDEYFVVNADGSESILHVDNFRKPMTRSKTPKRIQIILSDDEPNKSFQEQLQEILAK